MSTLGLTLGVFFRSHPGMFGRLFRCQAPRGLILCPAAAGFFGCRTAVLFRLEILGRGGGRGFWRGVSGGRRRPGDAGDTGGR